MHALDFSSSSPRWGGDAGEGDDHLAGAAYFERGLRKAEQRSLHDDGACIFINRHSHRINRIMVYPGVFVD